jgi:hypothetical protein
MTAPAISIHLASLNLFREADGTVAGGTGAAVEAQAAGIKLPPRDS